MFYHLFWCDGERSDVQSSLGAAADDSIEHGIGEHGREEQTKAAGQTLDAGEAAGDRTGDHREPDVVVSQSLVRLLAEQVTSFDHLLPSAHWNQSTDLKTSQRNIIEM